MFSVLSIRLTAHSFIINVLELQTGVGDGVVLRQPQSGQRTALTLLPARRCPQVARLVASDVVDPSPYLCVVFAV